MKAGSAGGVALPLVLVTLFMLEAVVALLVLATVDRSRSTRLGVETLKARAAAEAGVWALVTEADPVTWVVPRSRILPGGAAYRVWPIRLSRRAYVAQSTAQSGDPTAESTVALLTQRFPIHVPVGAALSYRGTLSGIGDLRFDPPIVAGPWDVCGPTRAEIEPRASLYEATVDWTLPAADRVDLLLSVVQPGPVLRSGSICDVGTQTNWGDPADPRRPCASFFPTLLRNGNLTVLSGTGQGTLFVRGDLTLDGGFVYHGLIVVEGSLFVGPGGATVRGALIATGDTVPHRIEGSLVITPSRCLVELGLPSQGPIRPYPKLSWIELP